METTKVDPGTDPILVDEPELDFYTIPIHSRWFLWDEIHETERIALKEFFEGGSITRTPKIYKEYRDFIINKYREEPSRRLTFTEVRKSLVGDVSLLRKVFLFLENWGLINFGAPPSSGGSNSLDVEKEKYKVKIEEGAPNGIRVVAMPNSLKPILPPPKLRCSGDAIDPGVQLPPLMSYSDAFGILQKQQVLKCSSCGEKCDPRCYVHAKGDFLICTKCFESGKCWEKRSKNDFELVESDDNGSNIDVVWSEAETLLLLESVLNHGDDWDLVAQNVKTKTKLDCISKLIELPLRELTLGSSLRNNYSATGGTVNNAKQILSSSDFQQTMKTESHRNESHQNGDAVEQGPPLKKQCIASLSDSKSSLMKQASLISTMVGPHITAVAAEAAITAICAENSCPREIFTLEDSFASNESCLQNSNCVQERDFQDEDSKIETSSQSETQDHTQVKDDIPLVLRVRAATATALGAAAGHAKLLADQEDREVEHLVATIIQTQMEKLQHKISHFEELEMLMEKEYSQIEELKDYFLGERIEVLQRSFSAGISRWKDYPFVAKA